MILELNDVDIDDVSGGNWLKAALQIVATEIGIAIGDGLVQTAMGAGAAAGRWVAGAAPGGADSGTWTNIGHSQMGA